MKLSKKIIVGSLASILALGTGIPLSNQNISPVAAATTSNTNTLKLAHGAYVYNKKGQRLAKYRGSQAKTYLRKNANVKYAGTIQPIEKDSKQYYLLNDDNYNQSWLPYKKIKGKYYYNIGHGGYINAANINEINGQPLYVANATVKITNTHSSKSYTVGSGEDKRTIKNGESIKVDGITSTFGDPENIIKYKIKGTSDALFQASIVKTKPKQRVKSYTNYSYVTFNKKAGTYDNHGTKIKEIGPHSLFLKNDLYPIEAQEYIWINSENKAELFNLLKNSWSEHPYATENYARGDFVGLIYVKASDTRYCSGPYLKPINTPEQAQADSKTATNTDKKELQNLIAQSAAVSKAEIPNANRLCDINYNDALKLAQNINKSTTSSILEVKTATSILSKTQTILLKITPEQEKSAEILDTTYPYVYK